FIRRPNCSSEPRTQINQVLKKRYRTFLFKLIGEIISRFCLDNFVHYNPPYISLVLNPCALRSSKASSTSGGNFPYHSRITGFPVAIYFLSCTTIVPTISFFSFGFFRENPGQYFTSTIVLVSS